MPKFQTPPTRSQLYALASIRDHGNPWPHTTGRAQHGGYSGVVLIIKERGWADSGDSFATHWRLTERGRKLLEALED